MTTNDATGGTYFSPGQAVTDELRSTDGSMTRNDADGEFPNRQTPSHIRHLASEKGVLAH